MSVNYEDSAWNERQITETLGNGKMEKSTRNQNIISEKTFSRPKKKIKKKLSNKNDEIMENDWKLLNSRMMEYISFF